MVICRSTDQHRGEMNELGSYTRMGENELAERGVEGIAIHTLASG
jgi:hypothetical protein